MKTKTPIPIRKDGRSKNGGKRAGSGRKATQYSKPLKLLKCFIPADDHKELKALEMEIRGRYIVP